MENQRDNETQMKYTNNSNFVFLFVLTMLLNIVTFENANALNPKNDSIFRLNMVHHNPGEDNFETPFNDPLYIKEQGFNGQVVKIFVPCAISYDNFDKELMPVGSKDRVRVEVYAKELDTILNQTEKAGIPVYPFTDLLVLPKVLVEKYGSELARKDNNGGVQPLGGTKLNASILRKKAQEVLRSQIAGIFNRFPQIDGLVIRFGETYLHEFPDYAGASPAQNPSEHIVFLNLLRNEICVKYNKKLFFRTWDFYGFHTNPNYYLQVTNAVKPHPNLFFVIKHTQGDFHRTFEFNPTLGLGKHKQLMEVQCQREYEGKGAYPNYIMDGVINGFEEYTHYEKGRMKCLDDFKNSTNFAGISGWSHGGGWVGPYISNEFWNRLNAYVLTNWTANTSLTENDVFNQFMDQQGIKSTESRQAFRQLALLSAKAILRGHASAKLPFKGNWPFWMRDEFLSGIDTIDTFSKKLYPSEGYLNEAFIYYYQQGILQQAVDEKFESVRMWETIEGLSKLVKSNNPKDDEYIRVSSLYGLYLHRIIASGWRVMALGYEGDKTGTYNKPDIVKAISDYDTAWLNFNQLKKSEPSCATLYKPFAFVYKSPTYYHRQGMGASIDKYRIICQQ